MRYSPIAVLMIITLIFLSLILTTLVVHTEAKSVFNIRTAIVLAGVDEEPLIKPFYTTTLGNITLQISVSILHINISSIYKALKMVARINNDVPDFVHEYLSNIHPDWHIESVEWVRADEAEVALYIELMNITKSYDYVLLLFYAPPQKNSIRIYYISRYLPELERSIGFIGLTGFGGNTKLYFIDLSAIPSRHPTREEPIYMIGTHFNYTNNPPLWDINSSKMRIDLITRYVENYLNLLVARFAASTVPWRPWHIVNITIVDFSNGNGAERVLKMLSPSTITYYLSSISPLISWHVEIHVVEGNTTPFRLALENALRFGEFLALQSEDLQSILSHSPELGRVRVESTYVVIPVYIFVHSIPLHITSGRGAMNFTGAASDLAVVITVPGYENRIAKMGLNTAIAHEVGHMIGLAHPFMGIDTKRGLVIDWSMDFLVTPMSYAPTIAGWLGGLFYYEAQALCRAQIAQILETAKRLGIIISDTDVVGIYNGKCIDIGLEIQRKILYRVSYPYSSTVTISHTMPIAINFTITKTVVEPTTEYRTEILERTTTIEKTVTTSVLYTKTFTTERTERITTIVQDWITTTVIAIALLLIGFATGYIAKKK
ncbi:hypothetical protein Igag_1146 [Ignisphaera aggregans DSM 17230]|uniref:Uncharacterized protein n=1 Tax=Ignisphaera aggregans (strain DSM 17230 / JCM 13409 / AQ1.S1) TaxID=583356 RepID=E0SP10_IGNAA|nr:hypothetical protein Igag_1146 [Ignisphaera aggregans DSM 17230]